MHVMPRWTGDGLLRVYPPHVETPEVAIRAAVTTDIRAHLA